MTNITETVEEGKPNIITSVQELHHRPSRRHGFARNDSRNWHDYIDVVSSLSELQQMVEQ